MAREVTESVRIVIKTADGGRVCVEGKGSAPQGIRTAFVALSPRRREWLLQKLQVDHARLTHAEALAPAATSQPTAAP